MEGNIDDPTMITHPSDPENSDFIAMQTGYQTMLIHGDSNDDNEDTTMHSKSKI